MRPEYRKTSTGITVLQSHGLPVLRSSGIPVPGHTVPRYTLPPMGSLALVIIMTVFSDVAGVLAIRGLPFLAHESLRFGNVENLLLVLTFGLVYVPGALASHRLCAALGERRCLAAAVALEAAVFAGVGIFWRHPASMFVCMAVIGLTGGVKWPVIESYVSAGRAGPRQARAIGLFNLSWAGIFPLALFGAGPIIDFWPAGLFLVCMVMNAGVLALLPLLTARPLHLADRHPTLLSQEERPRWARLRTVGRLLNLLSQCAIGALGALMPAIWASLGYPTTWATGLSGVMDLSRFLGFLVLQWYPGWHGRRSPLIVAMAAMTAGFFLIVLGGSTPTVLAGEVLFGLGAALAYYASLYYGMAVQNAAVEAGGVHEALIGLGMAVGPVSGLLGMWMVHRLHSATWGSLAGFGPMFLLGLAAAGWFLRGVGAKPARGPD